MSLSVSDQPDILAGEISPQFIEYLQQALSWSDTQIEEHKANWQQELDELLAPVTGKWIGLNATGKLTIRSFPDESDLDTLRLSSEPGRVGKREIKFFDQQTGKPADSFSLPPDSEAGILFTEKSCYLFAESIKTSPYLPEIVEYVDWAPTDLRTEHLDIFPLHAANLAFVALREKGEVYAISMATHAILESWQIRSTQSSLAINFSLDASGKVLYISDNVSTQLHMIDIPSLGHRVYKSGLGILGSLAAAPVPGKLYMTILKPNFNVVYFDVEKTVAEYSLDVRGDSWTEQKLYPQDSFHELSGGNYVFLSQHPKGALVNLIDGEEIQVTRKISLGQALPPSVIARPEANPYLAAAEFDFRAYLLAHDLLQASELSDFHSWLEEKAAAERARELAEQEAEAKAEQAEQGGLDPLRRPRQQPKANPNFRVHQPPKQDESLWKLIDKPAQKMDMPAGSEQAICDLIVWAFYRMTLTNLRIHAAELKKVQKIALKIKGELEQKQVVLAKVDNILGRHRFETPIDRRSVLELLTQQKLEGEFFRLEDLCPLCQTPIEEDACPACAFRLRHPKHEELAGKAYSAEPSDFLFPGQILLPQRRFQEVLCMNIWRQPVQQIKEDGKLLRSIHYALVLPNRNFLVLDRVGNKLVELSPAGEVVWKARLALKAPTLATFYEGEEQGLRYIVLDQGNKRVLELDPSGRHHRRYPTTRTAEEFKLKMPSDIQQIPNGHWIICDPGAGRILIVDTRGDLVLELSEGLEQPSFARQNFDGQLEVIDLGLKTWLMFDADYQEVGRFEFWPPPFVENEAWSSKSPPDYAARLHSGEWILMGEDYFFQMAPNEGLLRWIAEIPNPAQESSLLKVKFHTKSQSEIRQEQIQRHFESLKKVFGLNQSPDEKLQHLAKYVQFMKVKKGQWLLQPNFSGHAMYMILSGSLERVAPEEGYPVIFALGEGEICGQESVIETEKKAFKPGIRVLEDAELLMLERGEFKRAVMGFPRLFQFVKQVHQDHQRRIRQFQERKTEALRDQLRSKIAESLVKDFDVFKAANQEFFDAITDCLQANAFMPEQAVCSRGESGGSMYFIYEGQVGILRKGEDSPEIVLGPGDYFGEMALLNEAPRSATVLTLDYCKMFELQDWQAQTLWRGFPWFKQKLELEAKKRQSDNAERLQSFARKAGIDREDLPIVHVNPEKYPQDDYLLYLCSIKQDVVFGINTFGEVLWHYGKTPEQQLFQPHQVKRLESSLLLVDTGNDRVLEIDLEQRRVLRKWSKGLNQPVSADLTPEGFLLVANLGAQELAVVDNLGRTMWTYKAPKEIKHPTYVQITPQGTILFTDKQLHVVYEIERTGESVWSHGSYLNPGESELQLNEPVFAVRLDDGSTLIGDSGNQRLVRVFRDDEFIPIPLKQLEPPLAFDQVEVLPQGDIILYSASQDRILRLGPKQDIVWQGICEFPLAVAQSESVESKEPHWILDLELLQAEESQDVQDAQAAAEAESSEEDAEGLDSGFADLLAGGHWAAGEENLFSEAGSPMQPVEQEQEELFEGLDDILDAADAGTEPPEAVSTGGDASPWDALSFLEDEDKASQTFVVQPVSMDRELDDLLGETLSEASPVAPDAASAEGIVSQASAGSWEADLDDMLDDADTVKKGPGTAPLPDLDDILGDADTVKKGPGTAPLPDLDSVLPTENSSQD